MPVYGPNVTISGRSLRTDFGIDEQNWVLGRQCNAFIPAISGDGVIAAKASFTGNVSGNIIFVSCVYVVTVLQPYNPKPSNPSLILHPHTSRFSATIAMVFTEIPVHRYMWTSTTLL